LPLSGRASIRLEDPAHFDKPGASHGTNGQRFFSHARCPMERLCLIQMHGMPLPATDYFNL
jgi:hypothetical protein